MPAFTIIRPGLLTTVQDCGRWGFQDRGVPVCGAMDLYSHRLANRIVGNPDEAATLEVTLMGPTLTFDSRVSVAVAGGAFALILDEIPVPMNARLEAQPGSSLRLGARSGGARAYIAFAGGIEVPEVFSSRSTHLLTRMGGHLGRALRTGDRLAIGTARGLASDIRKPLSLPDGGARLRVIPGPWFAPVSGLRFRVSAKADRMGYRLEGNVGNTAGERAELVSKPVPTGTLQLTPTGEPILLMADHATAGGYPIAAVVIEADLPTAGQLAPGDWVEFVSCSLDEADEAIRAQETASGRGRT